MTNGFAGFTSWLVEGCRIAQPLEPLAGTRVNARDGLPPGALVSVQGGLEVDGVPVLVGAPALLGASGEAASLLLHPAPRLTAPLVMRIILLNRPDRGACPVAVRRAPGCCNDQSGRRPDRRDRRFRRSHRAPECLQPGSPHYHVRARKEYFGK